VIEGREKCLTLVEEAAATVVVPGVTVRRHRPSRQCRENRDEVRNFHDDGGYWVLLSWI
jgi:hypothetical protein